MYLFVMNPQCAKVVFFCFRILRYWPRPLRGFLSCQCRSDELSFLGRDFDFRDKWIKRIARNNRTVSRWWRARRVSEKKGNWLPGAVIDPAWILMTTVHRQNTS